MTQTFAVVFQMGKVASTALTAALNTLPDVTAVQSHFLGSDALGKVLNVAIDPENSDYFFHHQLGQLTQNIEYTRQINRIRAGHDPRRLVVLSLSRAPFAWFRSSLVQDIEGHADTLENLATCGSSTTREGRIGAGLTRFLTLAADRLEEFESVDAYRQALRNRAPGAWDNIADWPHPQRQLLLTSMRPSDWFDLHFPSGLNLTLSQMSPRENLWHRDEGNTQIAILRYEDLEDAFPEFCDLIFSTRPTLNVHNASNSKPLAKVIEEAFAGDQGTRLQAALSRSRYARHFGYA